MQQPDVQNMSLDDLMALQKTVSRTIEKAKSAKKQEALDQVRKLVQQYELSYEEVTSVVRAIAKRGKAPALYRNPTNPRQTWSGKGMAPEWFKKVKDPESLRIPNT